MPIRESFILKTVGKENMIIPLAEGNVDFSKVYNVSETGAFIFSLLKEGKSLDEVLNRILREYDITEDIAKSDLLEFVDAMKERGIYYD